MTSFACFRFAAPNAASRFGKFAGPLRATIAGGGEEMAGSTKAKRRAVFQPRGVPV